MKKTVHNIYAVNRWRPTTVDQTLDLETYEDALLIIPATCTTGVSASRQSLGALAACQAQFSFNDHNTQDDITAALKAYLPEKIKKILWLGSSFDVSEKSDHQDLQYGIEEKIFFRFFKSLLALKCDEVRLNITVVTKNNFRLNGDLTNTAINAGLHGFIGAAAKEYSHWSFSLLDVDDIFVTRSLFSRSLMFLSQDIEKNDVKGQTYCSRNNQWYAEHLEALPDESGNKRSQEIYRDNGVYLIIGGAGGLGRVWTESILERYDAHIIWAGRKAINDEIRHSLSAMEKRGCVPQYISVDATQPHEMEQLRHTIQSQYGRLNGIIHSAIVLEDKTVANMSEANFNSAMSAKVDVCRNIENYFADLNLDFIAFYSSIQSFARQAGQGNYASGCTFKDSFSHYLQTKFVNTKVKTMNWGYWGSVGVVSNVSYQRILEKSGIASIKPSIGMFAFEQLIAGDQLQASFIAAYDPEKITLLDKATLSQENPRFGFAQSRAQSSEYKTEGRMMKDVYDNEYYIALRNEGVFYLDTMDSYFCQIVAAELETLGVFLNREISVEEVILQTHIQKGFSRWLTEALMSLVREGYLSHRAGTYTKTARFPTSNAHTAWSLWNAVKVDWLEDPNKAAQVNLVEALLAHIKEILTGKIKATDVMFPDSSMRMVEGIYKNNRVADYFNLVLSKTVVDEITRLLAADPHRRIRILEVGAGTGGTTAVLLKHLAPYQTNIEEYCYTDLSKSFLFHAQREYGPGNSFLRYEIFNVEKSVDEQPLQRDYYDIAVATNVLHATSDIAGSIRRVWELLNNNGSLIVNELSRNTLFNHLTFGFLDGWWLYNDEQIRVPGSPVLEPATWRDIALQVGYGSTRFPAELAHDMGQFVMLMRVQKYAESIPREVFESGSIHSPGNESSMSNNQPAVNVALLKSRSQEFFTSLIAEVVQLPVNEIALDLSLEKLGFDSILVVTLTNKLREHFEQVRSSLLFDIDSVEGIIDYFIENDKHALAALLGITLNDELWLAEGIDSATNTQTIVTGTPHTQTSAIAPAVTQLDIINLGAFSPQEVDTPSASLPRVFDSNEKTYPEHRRSSDIAIIGLSGTYPGSRTLEEFWENLSQARDLVTSVPKARWDQTGFNRVENPENFKGGFIDGFDQFDADFFGFSEKDALLTDPQERKFLECAFSVLEDAGYTKESLAESHMTTGVYVGAMYQEYQLHSETAKGLYEGQAISNSFASIANRVSYMLNLEGPSIAIDSMCSSSLSALHLACSALKLGEIDYAIAGGVNLTLHPNKYSVLKQGGDLSQNGKCASFAESADGYIPGEGVGAVLLKRYEDALLDGDHIYGVITGSHIAHAGKTNGYTVPSPKAHSKLISKVVQQAGIRFVDISYIEAHGTGTNLGDAIEIDGLKQAFSTDKVSVQQGKFCSIGSVKSNIGHCESAAGMAGLTKILLQLKHQQIVPSIHSRNINKNLKIEKTSFSIPQSLSHWRLPNKEITKRIAGLSSFGAGGTNAHFIIEEHEEVSNIVNDLIDYPELIILSAKSKEALHQRALQLLGYVQYNVQQNTTLNSQPRYWLGNIAYTLQTGRTQMPHRLSFLADSIEHLEHNLDAFLNDKKGKSPLHVCYGGEMDATAKMLYEDDSLELILSEWLKQGKYQNIAALWTKGLVIKWDGLLGKRGKRISLPTYPFSQNRHWLPMGPFTAPLTQKADVAPLYEPVSPVARQTAEEKIVVKAAAPIVSTSVSTPLTVKNVAPKEKSLFIHRWEKVEVVPQQLQLNANNKICVIGLDTLDYFQRDLEACSLDSGSSSWQQILPNGFAQSFADLAKSVARQLAKKVKAWLADNNQTLHLHIIMPFDRQYQLYSALTGALEQHMAGVDNVKLTVIYCEALCSFTNVSTLIHNTPDDTSARVTEYLCAHDSIYTDSLHKSSQPESGSSLNDNCVYVLANGLNQIGDDVIRTIDDETSGCHIAILGDGLGPNIDEKVASLQERLDNTKVSYYTAELDDRKSVFNALLLIKEQLGDIHGVHYIVPSDDKVQQHKEPLKDKVLIHHLAALINLDEATYSFDSKLQIFSTVVTSEESDSKQLSTLAKAFSRYRASLQEAGYREGKTVALEIEGKSGTDISDAFVYALDKTHSDEHYAFIWKTAVPDAAQPQNNVDVKVERPVTVLAPEENDEQKYEKPASFYSQQAVVSWLVSISSELVNREPSSFNKNATFVENGYESSSIVGLCELINSRLGLAISVVVFFEHDTLLSLAQYLITEHGEQIEDVLETELEG